jgi:4-aminobutyrate aminotransferase-like enzyme
MRYGWIRVSTSLACTDDQSGKSTIRLAPPLCITKAEVDEGLLIFEQAITDAEEQQGLL